MRQSRGGPTSFKLGGYDDSGMDFGGDVASCQSFAASSQSFTASCLPRDKSSESDEEEWQAMHLLSKLEVPQKDLDADVG